MEKNKAIEEISKILEKYRSVNTTGFKVSGKGNLIIDSKSVGHKTGFDITGNNNVGVGLESTYLNTEQTIILEKFLHEVEENEPKKSIIQQFVKVIKEWGPIGVQIIDILIRTGVLH